MVDFALVSMMLSGPRIRYCLLALHHRAAPTFGFWSCLDQHRDPLSAYCYPWQQLASSLTVSWRQIFSPPWHATRRPLSPMLFVLAMEIFHLLIAACLGLLDALAGSYRWYKALANFPIKCNKNITSLLHAATVVLHMSGFFGEN